MKHAQKAKYGHKGTPHVQGGPSAAPKKTMKNQATVYNQQTFEIAKVRINRIMTVDGLRKKIASQFDTDPTNLEIKVGAYETRFDGSKPKEEVRL